MTARSLPSTHAYVIKLTHPAPEGSSRLCGRVEHVGSGRRHEFHDGASLLELLAQEEARTASGADRASVIPAGLGAHDARVG